MSTLKEVFIESVLQYHCSLHLLMGEVIFGGFVGGCRVPLKVW